MPTKTEIADLEMRIKNLHHANRAMVTERAQTDSIIRDLKHQVKTLRDELARCGDGRLVPRGERAPALHVPAYDTPPRAPKSAAVALPVELEQKPSLTQKPPKPQKLKKVDIIVEYLQQHPFKTRIEIANALNTTPENISATLYQHRDKFTSKVGPSNGARHCRVWAAKIKKEANA